MVLAVDAAQFLTQEMCGGGLRVDLVFEIEGVHFHELVGVAGVAVFASEFATAIGVDGPLEGHGGFSAVQNAAGGDFKILDGALSFEQFALGG